MLISAFTVCGADAVELFAAGYKQAAHFDGENWNLLYEELGINERLSSFYAVWALSESDLYAAGRDGLLAHYDGSEWTEIETETGFDLNDIWAASGSDIFVVGDGGVILYFNGVLWKELQSKTTSDLNAVWGVSENSVYAAGDNILLHYENKKWNVVDTGYPRDFRSVWASSDTDIYIGSNYSYLLHFDGASWSEMIIPYPAVDIWGSSASDVFLAFPTWYCYHYDGASWSDMYIGHSLTSLSGTSSTDVYGVSEYGRILHYNGSGWSLVLEIDHDIDFYGVHALSEDFIVAAGRFGGENTIAYVFDGAEWSSIVPFVPTFQKLWGSSPDNVFIGGTGPSSDSTYIYHWDGAELTEMVSFPGLLNNQIWGIWGSAGDDLYAISDYTIFHYDGFDWTTAIDGTIILRDIHGNSGDNIYAVGGQGSVYHYDGIEWSQVRHVPPSGYNQQLECVWVAPNGEVFAGGIIQYYDHWWNEYYSVIVHFDGIEWNETYPHGVANFSPVLNTIGGCSADDILCGGYDYGGHSYPNLLHFDGIDWTDFACPVELNDLWVNGPDDAYLLSRFNYRCFHYDGIDWTEIPLPTSRGMTALHGWDEIVSDGETPFSAPRLVQNYPNPFNPATTISFNLSKESHVLLRVYDVSGKRVATLLDKVVQAGTTEIPWNGKDDRGESMASGLYFYRLTADDFDETRKMVLLR